MEFVIALAVASLVIAVLWYRRAQVLEELEIASADFEEVVDEVKEHGLPVLEDEQLLVMTKKEIEEYGRTLGVELDRRKTKKNMIADLRDFT